MKLQGAVILTGSLYWEDPDNCIQLKDPKILASKRKNWRAEKLDMNNRNLISLPIRYGRKSTSRYCTYTMTFSNSVEKNGHGYVVPYFEKINVKDNFNQLYCQAIELAKVEGICKSGENTLVKKWGSVGLMLSKRFIENLQDRPSDLLEFWKSHYSQLEVDKYRINESEEVSIDKDGILNFNIISKNDDIDYFLATPISPNVKSYPDGAHIAKAMNETRENYYRYFVENYNNGIKTKDDFEIIKYLPEKIKASLQS